MGKYRVIVNPVSGRGNGEKAVEEIASRLSGHNLEYDMVLTERPWHAADLAQEAAADGVEAVVAAGGDGTVNEVLNGLMCAKTNGTLPTPALGVLCVGRGNDFAFGMGLPQDLGSGCRVLAEKYTCPIDVGHVVGGLYPQGRYFGNGVGIGFDAVVGFEAMKMKHLQGFASYIVAALKTIFLYFRAPLVRIEFDGKEITQRALMVSTMNGRRMGGGFMMAPTSQPADGLFDLCIADQVSRSRIFALIPEFMKGTQARLDCIHTARAAHVVVTALEGSLPAHSDGETLCTEGCRLEMNLLPSQIRLLSPAPEVSR